ncbi:MAG: twin-arginine translocase TatA/TatE family subunit [Kiritimatiellae bacterium]|nr:twin-arginine translocase TatA/TatE family subunit [Kiritimatiellia bacterium]
MIGQFAPIAFWTPGGWEMLVILVVAVLIFGRRLPEIAKNMGKSVSEFKKGVKEADKAKDDILDDVRDAGDKVDVAAKDADLSDDADQKS